MFTGTNVVTGTPAFMAPEQILGNRRNALEWRAGSQLVGYASARGAGESSVKQHVDQQQRRAERTPEPPHIPS